MLVAKYKFDKSIYENLIPVFNDGYEGYSISDEIDENNSNHVIRTIECDVLPTMMRFGTSLSSSEYVEGNEIALLEVIDINISELTSMYQMFKYCKNLTSLDISNWNTSKVTDMAALFMNCNNLTSLDVSNFDTSNVTRMDYMFCGCTNLTSLDVSNWDTSKVTNMGAMFYNCTNLTSLDVSNWDTSKVTDMNHMFKSCTNLTSLDVSNWDTSKATGVTQMFSNTSSLQYIRCNNASTINTLAPLLYNRTSSTQGKIITTSSTNVDTTTLSSLNWNIDTSSGTKIAEYKFDKSIWNSLIPEFNEGYSGYFCNDRIEDESKPNIVTRDLVGYGGLPTLMRFGTTITNGNISVADTYSLLEILNMNTSALETMQMMFYRCCNVSRIDCDWDISKVTNMYATFSQCTNLTSLDVSNFDTSNVTRMDYMFCGCTNLTSLDVSNWDTSNVTNMNYMFRGCSLLTTIDTSLWKNNKPIQIGQLFRLCTNLKSINLSNITDVTNITYLVDECTNLVSLDISNIDLSNVEFIQNICSFTPNLKDIGMLYCSQDTINKIIPYVSDKDKTIWIKDTKASDYTATDYITFKDYKEDNRTLYLNSPLLEGDEIVNKDGKLYHYHKMGSVVLDGSEKNWGKGGSDLDGTEVLHFFRVDSKIAPQKLTTIKCDTIQADGNAANRQVYARANLERIMPSDGTTGMLQVLINKSRLKTIDINGFKQWLSQNPTTVIYELAEPYYELISDDPLIVKSYAEGKLDTSSIITPTSIQSIPYEEELTYLYTSTQYCIQFNSTANCTVDITLGGTKVESKSISVGLNKIYITTPSELVDNKLIINTKGSATISKVVVVNSNAEFDYFDGLKSSFEDCLVTDVDNENYGKYEVGVKIVGKNLFNVYGNINEYYNSSLDNDYGKRYNHQLLDGGIIKVIARTWNHRTRGQIIKVKKNTNYTVKFKKVENVNHRQGIRLIIETLEKKVIHIAYNINTNHPKIVFNSLDNDYIYFTFAMDGTQDDTMYSLVSNIQIEEGGIATSYEPYKETNATIYLNSPLLKGDRIEVVDGKLCHYHKMGSVVLDGSEDWTMPITGEDSAIFNLRLLNITSTNRKVYCDTIHFAYRHPNKNIGETNPYIFGESIGGTNNVLHIFMPYSIVSGLSNLKQWLQQNPTTVVYELAEPYYEDITPIQSSFVISTVSEGDMEIFTDLPIKSNITYLTNIASAVLMEQQLDELDNSTESLTNIVEDEINE